MKHSVPAMMVAALLGAALAACAPSENRRSTDPGLLSGPVDGWPRGQFSIVRAEVPNLGSQALGTQGAGTQTTAGSVNFDGTFEISLPEPGQVSRLVSREGLGVNCAGARIEPAEARGAIVVLAVYDRVGRRQGALVQATNRPGSNESGVVVSRVYAERETSISGNCDQNGITTTYNLRLVPGWNVQITQLNGASRRVQTAALPEGLSWFFVPGS
jgi:hypothetical protein